MMHAHLESLRSPRRVFRAAPADRLGNGEGGRQLKDTTKPKNTKASKQATTTETNKKEGKQKEKWRGGTHQTK